MKIFYSDHFLVPLPQDHRFPMPKYARLRQRVWESGLCPPQDWISAEAAEDEQILHVHSPDYLMRLKSGALTDREMRRIGFPWSPELIERSRRSVGGTIGACRAALQEGVAVNLAGGTHHAYPDHGEGFCVFNDVAIAIRTLQAEGRLRRSVIIDLDVHQGNGTAAIFAADPDVFTFSVHGAKNFPFHKELSDLDLALPDHSDDQAYLQAVTTGLEQVFCQPAFDLAVYIAGADPFAGDQLGRMSVSKEGLAQRDRLVFERCWQAGLPVAVVMGGGYAREIEDTVGIHLQTVQLAAEYAARGWNSLQLF